MANLQDCCEQLGLNNWFSLSVSVSILRINMLVHRGLLVKLLAIVNFVLAEYISFSVAEYFVYNLALEPHPPIQLL